jgi:serine phosphatase RsbU (regulator of sigma subunit)
MQKKIQEQQFQLEDDLRHAAIIQRCLLPDPIDNPYLSIHYRYEPLIAIGGDYLTVHQYSPQEVTIALYDVCGHGVSAALTANLIHNQMQQRLAERRPPSNIINLLNRFLSTNIDETSMFVTMAIVSIDLEEGRMIVANAGHPDLFLWRRQTNELEPIASHMPPVGMIPKILGKVNESALDIASGDRLILYTDGFLESRNLEGKMLGRDGLQNLILQNCRCAPMDFLHTMYDDLSTYRDGEQDDDLTLIVIDVK